MTSPTIDEPLVCSIICSYIDTASLEKIQTVCKTFYETAQMILHDCTVIATCGLYTRNGQHYLPYLDIPLPDYMTVVDRNNSIVITDTYIKNRNRDFPRLFKDNTFIYFTHVCPMYLGADNTLVREYPQLINGDSEIIDYVDDEKYDITEYYATIKDTVIHEPDNYDAITSFLDHHTLKYEHYNQHPLKKRLFKSARSNDECYVTRLAEHFREIYKETGFIIEVSCKHFKVYRDDNRMCTIEEFINFITGLGEYEFCGCWPDILAIKICDDDTLLCSLNPESG